MKTLFHTCTLVHMYNVLYKPLIQDKTMYMNTKVDPLVPSHTECRGNSQCGHNTSGTRRTGQPKRTLNRNQIASSKLKTRVSGMSLHQGAQQGHDQGSSANHIDAPFKRGVSEEAWVACQSPPAGTSLHHSRMRVQHKQGNTDEILESTAWRPSHRSAM